MQSLGPPDERPLRGLVESRIEAYGGQHRASAQSTGSNLYARRGLMLDPGRLRFQDYVSSAKGSGQTRILSPRRFREPETEKRLGSPFAAGPPHSPKLKVKGPSRPIATLTTRAVMSSRDIRAKSSGSPSNKPPAL